MSGDEDNCDSSLLELSNGSKDNCSLFLEELIEVVCDEQAVGEQLTSNINHQRQRLILIRHSEGCCHNNEDNLCEISPFCVSMKKVLKHLKICKDLNCTVRKALCIFKIYHTSLRDVYGYKLFGVSTSKN